MSRSRKKHPIVKDVGYRKRDYWKTIRKTWKQEIRSGKEVLSNPKEIINDYDYCDWIYNYYVLDCSIYKEKAYRK